MVDCPYNGCKQVRNCEIGMVVIRKTYTGLGSGNMDIDMGMFVIHAEVINMGGATPKFWVKPIWSITEVMNVANGIFSNGLERINGNTLRLYGVLNETSGYLIVAYGIRGMMEFNGEEQFPE